MKIRHGAIVDNAVTYVYAKFGDDRLWNEKALADRKSDSNNTNNTNNKNVPGAREWGWCDAAEEVDVWLVETASEWHETVRRPYRGYHRETD